MTVSSAWRCRVATAATFCLTLLATAPLRAADDLEQLRQRTVARGIDYLRTSGRAEDGSYSRQNGPAVTALVVTALLRNGRSPDEPWIADSLKYIEGFVRPDGGVYTEGSMYRNYETCLAMLCFSEANKDRRYDPLLKRAEKFVVGIQWDESEGHDPSSLDYGGSGYGKHKRPDLSNTSFLIEALTSVEDPDQEAIQRALKFVSRCQNHESEHQTAPFAARNPDGGMIYTPHDGGYSQAGEADNGGLRSYASMTYAGLKSMIFAGVGPEDERVKAAYDWARKHYDLKSNPGMGQAGLYYYYHTFAKALHALGRPEIVDEEGVKHDWRRDLVQELARRQRSDGSWVNGENPRWLEGDANLVTGYALLALSYCGPAETKSSK